jgi:hypothetical protein
MMNYKKLWSLVSIALMLTVLMGCGRMELLQNDNIESYKFLDHQALAPGMSLQEALDTIQNPPADNPAKLSEAISTVMEVMGLTTSSTDDPYRMYSINDMAQAMQTALAGSGFSLSDTALQNIMISAINETINQVNSGSLDSTKPENAGLYALAQGVMQRTGKTTLTIEDASNPNLMDTAGFLVLTTAMNQAINSTVDDAVRTAGESAVRETADRLNLIIPGAPLSGDELIGVCIPKPKPLLGGLLTDVVKQQLANEPEVAEMSGGLIEQKKTEMLAVVDKQIANQVLTVMTSTIQQMQAEGMLQGISIPDLMDYNSFNNILNQMSTEDKAELKAQVDSVHKAIDDGVEKVAAKEIGQGFNTATETSQTEVKDFVETTATETGTTVNVEPVVPEHNQGSIIIQ